MKKIDNIVEYLDELFPNPKCELNYEKDYELLIAVMLSAQTTDKKVNVVTEHLWNKYKNIDTLKTASTEDLETIIKPLGTFRRKALYTKQIALSLTDKYSGIVPNDREYLESLPGIGHKTANVVLSNLFGIPAIAVDTHVSRVSKRLKLAKLEDNVKIIEKKLEKQIPKEYWSKTHHQLVLFGRYHCTARNPKCQECKLNTICKYKITGGN